MADTISVGEELEHRLLDAIRRTDTMTLETLKAMTHVIEPMTPAIRSVTPPLVYDFTLQLLAIQRKFAVDVLHLTERSIPAATLSADKSKKMRDEAARRARVCGVRRAAGFRPSPVMVTSLRVLSLDASAARWRVIDRCPPGPGQKHTTELSSRHTSPAGAGGTRVIEWTVSGGGHTWPGAPVPPGVPEPVSMEFDAAEEICRLARPLLIAASDRRL